MIASQMTHFLSPSRLSNSILDTFITSISKSLVLAFIWILLLSFIFMFFVYILGGLDAILLTSTDDLNNCKKNRGLWYSDGENNPANCPIGFSDLYNNIIWCYKQRNRYIQFFFCINRSKYFYRKFNGSTWFDWVEITVDMPAFYKNYSSIAQLLSGLFGSGMTQIDSSTDVDSLGAGVYFGIGWLRGDSGMAGYLICLRFQGDYRAQVAIDFGSNTNKIYHRTYNISYNGWGGWKEVTSV